MAVQSETELYAPVKAFLESMGYAVRSEVVGCDIAAVRGDDEELLIVEMKKTFNLPLLFQGIDRLSFTDRVYLAVEKKRQKSGAYSQQWNDIIRLCRRLGLGLMTVTFYKSKKPVIEVLCEPEPYYPRPAKNKRLRLLQEFRERSGDYNIGGSVKRKLVTAYREHALHCAWVLKREGPLKPSKVKERTGIAKTASILQRDYYGWFRRVDRGIYGITPQGEQALKDYADVIDAMLSPSETI